jgi:hypothetical protein
MLIVVRCVYRVFMSYSLFSSLRLLLRPNKITKFNIIPFNFTVLIFLDCLGLVLYVYWHM